MQRGEIERTTQCTEIERAKLESNAVQRKLWSRRKCGVVSGSLTVNVGAGHELNSSAGLAIIPLKGHCGTCQFPPCGCPLA